MNVMSDDESADYDVNIRMITFVVIAVFLILMSIYCIRIYADKKQIIKHEMRIEADILEGAFTTDLSYASYFLSIIAGQLQNDYMNPQYIQRILHDYHGTEKYHTVFGWRKYSWVDANFNEVITSINGVMPEPKNLPFIQDLMTERTPSNRDQIVFYVSKTQLKNDSLKLIAGVTNLERKNYVGYVVLSYDMATIIRRLNASKKNSYTNFIILDNKNSVIVQSKPVIYNIVNANQSLANHLDNLLRRLDFINKNMQEVSYVDMTSGISYYIKKIHGLPFVLVINVDDDEIKNNILDSVIKKFLEVSIFAFIFLLVVVSIYKRETYLRMKAEKATIVANRATQAKTNFLAFTAHEIRSPLGFVSTGSEIMIKRLFGPLNDKYHEYAAGIHQNAKTILDFITDILDESQIIEGKFKIVNESANIVQIIEQAVQINRSRADKKSITLNFSATGNIPRLICDERRMLQVMNNLLTNAIKYSADKTTINITIEVLKKQLVINVTDQGVGMTSDEIQIALSNYGVITKDDTNSIDSYGLGLPIVKMLLEAHEASLLIKSQPQLGTTVTIIFPEYKLTTK